MSSIGTGSITHQDNARTRRRCSATSARIWSLYGKLFGMPGSFACSAPLTHEKYCPNPRPRNRETKETRTALPLGVLLSLLALLPSRLLHLLLHLLPLVDPHPFARLCGDVSNSLSRKLFCSRSLLRIRGMTVSKRGEEIKCPGNAGPGRATFPVASAHEISQNGKR